MRNAILALLAAGAAYGYELKHVLDRLFEAVWPPINIGQIYTTLRRMERDGLVESGTVAQERRPDRVVYQITDAGKQALVNWFNAPGSSPRLRDDLFMKLILAKRSGVVDQIELVRRQSEEYFQALGDVEALSVREEGEGGRMRQLLIEGLALHLRADIRWLELWEETFSKEEEE
ncbi:PadR family transcriptional regulator [Chloroflexota bacterium]